MNITNEINLYADENDKATLLWLFSRYHMQSQWQFVAKCEFIRYGTQSYESNRKWIPTSEGRILYAHQLSQGIS